MATSRRLPSWDLTVTSGEIPESFPPFDNQPTPQCNLEDGRADDVRLTARMMLSLRQAAPSQQNVEDDRPDDMRLAAQMMMSAPIFDNSGGCLKTTFSDDR